MGLRRERWYANFGFNSPCLVLILGSQAIVMEQTSARTPKVYFVYPGCVPLLSNAAESFPPPCCVPILGPQAVCLEQCLILRLRPGSLTKVACLD